MAVVGERMLEARAWSVGRTLWGLPVKVRAAGV